MPTAIFSLASVWGIDYTPRDSEPRIEKSSASRAGLLRLEAHHNFERAPFEKLDAGRFNRTSAALIGELVGLGGCLFGFPQG